jgi:SulP family sulfate permease
VLDVYGSLFFAGARTLERQLPQPGAARNSVVILRMRGRVSLGATLVAVLVEYAARLAKNDNRLYLSGLSAEALRELIGSGRVDLNGPIRAFEVTPVVGASTRAARTDAEAWLIKDTVPAGPMPSQGRDE